MYYCIAATIIIIFTVVCIIQKKKTINIIIVHLHPQKSIIVVDLESEYYNTDSYS